MKDVFSWSSGFIKIWLYLEKASMKDSISCPVVDSTSRSMWGSVKQSFGHALLRSVKSTQTRHLPFFFFTTTGLASHTGYLTSGIKPASRSLMTSALTASARSGPSFRRFYLTDLKDGSTFSSCEITSVLIPVISPTVQANVVLYILRKWISLLRKPTPFRSYGSWFTFLLLIRRWRFLGL